MREQPMKAHGNDRQLWESAAAQRTLSEHTNEFMPGDEANAQDLRGCQVGNAVAGDDHCGPAVQQAYEIGNEADETHDGERTERNDRTSSSGTNQEGERRGNEDHPARECGMRGELAPAGIHSSRLAIVTEEDLWPLWQLSGLGAL